MHEITINIARSGHPTLDGSDESIAGHMWITLPDGSTTGYAPGGITPDDANVYDPGYYEYKISLTPEQYAGLERFLNTAPENGFGNDEYNALWNSCVDYVWSALRAAGLNPAGFEGDIVPWNNRDDIERIFNGAATIPSPIVLDLNGDGVVTTPLSFRSYFDHAADGFAERTGWVSSEDGLLVRDLSGNGVIDSGRELFGSETLLTNGRKASNGFEALKELDLNNEGVIDASDPAFAELRVWKDVNGNGRTDDGELLTLEEAGVSGINVAYNNSNVVDTHGNAHKQVGSYTTTNGETRTATDVWFNTNATYSRPTNWVDVPEDIALLPDAQGYGKVRDLHQSMAMDATGQLKALVTAFTQADTPEDRDALVTQIIYHWAGVENVDPNSRASRMIYGNAIGDARKLEALEEFMGEEWYGVWCWGTRDPNPHGRAAPVLLQAWDELKALVHGQLMAQSHVQDLFQQIMYRWDLEIEGLVGDLSGVAASLAQRIGTDREAGLTQLGDFLHSLKGMNMLGRLDVDGFRASLVPLGSDVEHTMTVALAGWVGNNVPTEGNDVLRGTQLDDVIDGWGGNDRLLGRGGNDTLTGGVGNDLLDGGEGDDHLRGGFGSDTYRFGRGDGHDTISEDSWVAGETDRIELKADLSADDVRLSRVRSVSGWQINDDLLLTIRDTGETLTVKNHFNESNRFAVEEIVFADGMVWGLDEIRSQVLLGGDGDDMLRGFTGRDDVLVGGRGNDVLEGGIGFDTYRYDLGDGQDLIVEGNTPGEDVLELGTGITPDDVTVRWTVQGDMAVSLPDGGLITVRSQAVLGSDQIGVEQLRFADGTVWNRAELAARALAATEGDDVIVGGYGNDTVDGGAGNDRFLNLGGYDTYRFGIGDGQDTIEGGGGKIVFKEGFDQFGVGFGRDGNDLVVTVSATGDAVRIKDWLGSWQRIDHFEFSNGTTLTAANVTALLNVESDSEILYGSPGDDVIVGTGKHSTIFGREGNDVLLGGEGEDWLYGEAGNDTLDGGADRDWLYGGSGNNSYIMAPGMGLDNAMGADRSVAENTVVFAADVRPEDVTLQLGEQSWSGDSAAVGYYNLVIGIGGNDALIVRSDDRGDLGHGAIQHFLFADGAAWTLADVIARADGGVMGWQQRYAGDPTTLVGSQADDTIYDYTGQSVTVRARGNDDYIQLAAGNDIVSAGTGNDQVYAGQGDDLIAGEADNDLIDAGDGDDVIVFNLGDGHDRLTVGDGKDIVSFGVGVTADMLSAALDRNGRVVLLIDGGTGGSIVLEGASVDNLPGDVERIQFIDAEGKTRIFDLAGWLRENVAALMAATVDAPLAFAGVGFELTGTVAPAGGLEAVAYAQSGDLFASANLANNTPSAGDDVLYGTPNGDTLDAGAGNDIALGLAGNDTILGGDGNDLIHGGDGDDVLDAGDGDDVIYGGLGADQLTGGTGNDQLFGEWGGDTYVYQSGHGEVIIDDDHRVLNWGYDGGEGGYGGEWDGGEGGYGGGWDGGEGGYGGVFVDDAPNILSFGPGIRPEDLRYSEENGDLVIEFAGSPGDKVILRGFEPSRATQTRSVDIIRFADGTEIVAESIEPTGKTEMAGDEGGWLGGTQFSDTLIGGDGDDVLEGGGGSDRLVGGAGSDVYRIHKDWGSRPVEILIAETWREQDFNRIELTGEVNADDLRLAFDGRDLLLRLNEEGDVIRFAGFDPRAEVMRAPVDEVRLPWHGVSLSFYDLLVRGVRIIGTPENDVLTGKALADWIEGLEGDDTMSGGAGGDIYIIEAGGGADTIIDSEDGAAPNTLVLPEGTTLDDVRLSYDEEGFLVLDLVTTGNRVRLSGFDPQNPLGPRAVERFRFGLEGDEIGYEVLLARGFDIVGTDESDALKGTTLTDRVWGGDGNDLIVATPGGDWLMGEGGNDTYMVNLGDGIVTIEDVSEEDAGNVLRFGPGIDPNELRNNLRFEADGNGGHVLIIPYGEAGDVVRLSGFNPQDVLGSHAVERFEFADGTAVDYATLVSWTFVVEGDNSGNVLTGTNVGDRLYGYDGDDVLEAGDGEDVLTGGMGNDVLRGGAGRDAYVVSLGDGIDVIDDDVEDGVGNVLTFGEGIAREDVRLDVDGDDLLIHYGANGDVVRVSNYAPGGTSGGSVIDTFEFADGTAVSLREFLNRAPQVANPIDDQVVLEDAVFSLPLPDDLFIDVDGDAIFTRVVVSGYACLPQWLQYDAATRTLYGTPDNDDVGEFDVIVQGMDALGASTLHSFHVTVQNTNDAPEVALSIVDQQATTNEPFNFVLPDNTFIDVDAGDVLSLSATGADGSPLPAWLMFDPATGTFSGTPTTAGRHDVRVTATDLAGASVSQTFILDILSAGGDLAPVTAPDTAIVVEDRQLLAWGNVLANDHDPEGERLRVADPGIRRGDYGWLTILPGGGYAYVLRNCSPQVQSLGVGETAVDRFGYLASNGEQETGGELAVTVQGTNDAPQVSRCLADVRLARGEGFAWQIPVGSFTDRDSNDQLIYTATLKSGKPLPSWLVFDAATQTFSGTAPANATGSLEVRVTAGDGHGQCSSAADVFKVRFGNKTVVPLDQRDNAGSANELDAAQQPGLAVTYQSPGGPDLPGSASQSVEDQGLASFLGSFKVDAKTQHPVLSALDRDWFEQWDNRQPPVELPSQTGDSIHVHWAVLAQALNRLDAQRQGLPTWSDPARGADLSGLVGLMQADAPATPHCEQGLSLACGTPLKTFSGLREGLGKLPW